MQSRTIFAIFLILLETCFGHELTYNEPHNEIISGAWILYIPAGFEVAKRIADAEGFQNVHEVPDLNLYHLYDLKLSEDMQEEDISIRLTKYEEIKYMTPSTREKILRNQYQLNRQRSRAQEDYYFCAGPESIFYQSKKPQFYSDPYYRAQWFLRSCSDVMGKETPSFYDMKIVQTWEQFKLTGNGIIVLVIDDGVYADHLELKNRVSMKYSYNYISNRRDPTSDNPADNHGTRCAGIIAAEANNEVCGVGIAPKVTIGGQKLLNGDAYNQVDEIEAVKYRAEEVDIVSMSLGDFDFKAFIVKEEPIRHAFQYGVEKGRKGKGILYVFPSGNGKEENETCSSDGGLQFIYKIVVGGAENNGDASVYAEGCASVMVVTHSGNGNPYAHITPDIGSPNNCFDNFNGTSAGTPVAAGILALVMEANPNLTWRDVKHAIAWTSEVAPLTKNRGWRRNGAGFYVHFDLGFGLMNAYEMVELAKNFPGTSPPMNECVVEYTLKQEEKRFNGMGTKYIIIPTDGCKRTPQEINYIEHVLVTVTIHPTIRGYLKIMLTSPQKTETQLLPPRNRDRTNKPIQDFSFLSVHNWGEQPQGEWILEIIDTSGSSRYGQIYNVELTFYGTREQPELHKKGPRKYYPFTLT